MLQSWIRKSSRQARKPIDLMSENWKTKPIHSGARDPEGFSVCFPCLEGKGEQAGRARGAEHFDR